jgi:hypothetical protein
MKLKNCLLSVLMVIGAVSSNMANAAAIGWNWGGYVPTADSPVVGGWGAYDKTECTYSSSILGSTVSCTDKIKGVVAFGLVGYIPGGCIDKGTDGAAWYGGSYLCGNVNISCPANTAEIEVAAPYFRADGVYFNPTVYASGSYNTKLSKIPAKVSLCVKTDTYQ